MTNWLLMAIPATLVLGGLIYIINLINKLVNKSANENQGRSDEQYQSLKEDLIKLETSHQLLQTQYDEAGDKNAELMEEKNNVVQLNTQNLSDISRLNAQLESAQKELIEVKNQRLQWQEKSEQHHNQAHHAQKELGELKSSLDEKDKHYQAQIELLQNSKEGLKKEFENLANEILERKGKNFKELNQESLMGLINPIHEELKGFKNKVENIHQEETKQRVALKTELENLQKLNQEITEQANQLTTALKGDKKIQGNWGELILENVLDNSGLRLNTDYKREVSINTEDGRLRPDAIVYLPQNKHLVIDAKTSLNAYTRYVNSDDPIERAQALKEHANAVKDRIKELGSKEYSKLPGINSPEVVVMFIPIESAYVEALKADEQIFQSALEKNILVATPTTLLTSLNIVRQLWRFEEQSKHSAALAERAEKFHSKLSSFLGSMEKVGSQLDRAKSEYDGAMNQLSGGRGNLIKQASDFHKLGVSVTKELPKALVEKAELELD